LSFKAEAASGYYNVMLLSRNRSMYKMPQVRNLEQRHFHDGAWYRALHTGIPAPLIQGRTPEYFMRLPITTPVVSALKNCCA
jgi:hypothetical protein